MKKPPQSKIILHGHGIGDLNDEDVESRAREIALISGRAADTVTENDRATAWAELQGELLPGTIDSDQESAGTLSRDPSEPLGNPGRRISNHQEDADSTAVERLANEGLEEAQHDQMLAARVQEQRQNRNS